MKLDLKSIVMNISVDEMRASGHEIDSKRRWRNTHWAVIKPGLTWGPNPLRCMLQGRVIVILGIVPLARLQQVFYVSVIVMERSPRHQQDADPPSATQ